MKSRTWQPRDFWRSIAFYEFRDSREWRYLLELNPSYDIRYHPAAGVKVNVSGDIGAGRKVPANSGGSGVLRTAPTVLAPIDTQPASLIPTDDLFFPYDTPDEYDDRLGAYTAMGIMNRDRTNGFSLDSRQALSDSQRP